MPRAIVATSPYPLRFRWERSALGEYTSFSWPLFVAGLAGLVIAQSATLVSEFSLGLAGVGAAVARGVQTGPAVALAVFGAAIVLLAIYGGDRRLRSALRFSEPEPVPGDARLESPARALAEAAYPSTIGLTGLTLISLWPRPPLAAFLAGILLGLAVMSLVGFARLTALERARHSRILVDYKASRVFEARR
jgi:O-antigen/teichoic acid export membrane protein